MMNLHHFTPRLGLAALLAATMLSSAAYAGEQNRAELAISEAKGKIDAGDKVGVGEQAPELQGQARETLRSAEDQLAHHHKPEAIAAAHHASELADQALVSANTRKAEAERARRDDIRDTAVAAQQSAANANVRADNAQQATDNANNRADSAVRATMDANNRANSAEASSAAANAQADALRNAPPPATTTVVTQHETENSPMAAPTHHKKHRVLHKRAHTMPTKTTTTELTTTHP